MAGNIKHGDGGSIQGPNNTAAVLLKQAAAKAFALVTSSGTPALANGLNSASLTDNGTGDTTVSFTAAFADSVFISTCSCSTEARMASAVARLANSVQIQIYTHDGIASDAGFDLDVMGDLA